MPLQPVHTAVVHAPSRLHFGMFSFGEPGLRAFGGVGMMIQSPGVRVRLEPAERFRAAGIYAERTRRFVEQVLVGLKNPAPAGADEPTLAARITVESAPREHVGLGLGTQLGLSIAAAICSACDIPFSSVKELARLAGRGARSAIGAYGFEQGGLLVEAGKRGSEDLSPLLARVEMPAEWRILLVIPRREAGLAGSDEQQAFARLPPVPLETTERLIQEAAVNLLPAAAGGDFHPFSASLYRFGRLAGTCFATEQGGTYAGEKVASLIGRLREMGLKGAGQSSWGPAVFAVCADADEAHRKLRLFEGWLRATDSADEYECLVTAPANRGAEIVVT
jgi:beta-RFAP synthase